MQFKHLETGLKSIFNDYDTFVIDLWGVIHNGIKLHQSAIEVLRNLKKNNKEFFLISNAPRPKNSVAKFLKKLDLEEKYFDHIYTSGDASLEALRLKKFGNKFFHIGPPKDFDLFKDFQENKTNIIEESEYLLCTGLFDFEENNLDYYSKFLNKYVDKKLICTNPDLIVHRGSKEEYCAGSVAKIFQNIGGSVIYYGKPYPDIYKNCIKDKKKVLAIGDNLNTDIKGANIMNYHSLFILNGVHKNEFTSKKEINLDKILKKYNLHINYFQNQLAW
ncbi:MAG: TIGR01459 family HAD-type hydrolase [Candidatus Pelagibacterales bacterium]|nr:MAG: TIGR01459 family HAD-type hydrolase [Pelagibacterales bacterium]